MKKHLMSAFKIILCCLTLLVVLPSCHNFNCPGDWNDSNCEMYDVCVTNDEILLVCSSDSSLARSGFKIENLDTGSSICYECKDFPLTDYGGCDAASAAAFFACYYGIHISEYDNNKQAGEMTIEEFTTMENQQSTSLDEKLMSLKNAIKRLKPEAVSPEP
jgi:hypothetical protein